MDEKEKYRKTKMKQLEFELTSGTIVVTLPSNPFGMEGVAEAWSNGDCKCFLVEDIYGVQHVLPINNIVRASERKRHNE